ncbi:MAG TPA: T9SS type A sorting domain-containing protein, partial [Saprospiraceae bacterium]|nr:T9SS type A sorting domain-containing protein [Saprospiraceae bacterium]
IELDSTVSCFSGFQQAFVVDDTQIEVLEVSSDLSGFDSLSWNVLDSQVRTSWVSEDSLLDETVTAGTKLLRFRIKALANVTDIPSEFYNSDIDNFAPEYIGIDSCTSDVYLDTKVTQIVGSSPFYSIGLDEISRDILLRGMDYRDIKEIRIYNQQGALIDQPIDMSPSGNDTWIRTSSWSTGLYYISVQTIDQLITQPITIVR